MYKIEVALLKNQVTLTLDTTGPSLHKRSYRQANVRAPLKETLAAAMILLSFWDRERPLIDPFCGSGTIPIEAAWIGRRIAPGLDRSFAAEAWPNISPQLWQEARSEARDAMLPAFPERLVGTDTQEPLLELARRNAAAGRSRGSTSLPTTGLPRTDEQTHARVRDHQPSRPAGAGRLAETRTALSADPRGAAQAAHVVAFHPDGLSAL